MNIKHAALRLLVGNMRWMTRYLGPITRPFVAWYAGREIIACGLRNEDGTVSIIYFPWQDRDNYVFTRKTAEGWLAAPAQSVPNFSGDRVLQVHLPKAQQDEIYRVSARQKNGRPVRSPTILIEHATIRDNNLLTAEQRPAGRVHLAWPSMQSCNPMIYFLALEDQTGQTLAAVYTRETNWEYPRIERASLSLGPATPPTLQRGATYTVKLLAVNFDGWVSCLARQQFIQ